jgi:hypothetical protein
MCRYALHPVKTHYACLPCRYTGKLDQRQAEAPRCPRCREPMVNLGKDFKAPRRAAETQWRKVEMLVAAGITFDSCGCNGPGPRPRTLSDAKTQLRCRRTHRKAWAPAGSLARRLPS